MELKDDSFVVVDGNKQQKVKCYTFHCKELDRDLIIHENTDNKNLTSVSDKKTGYRLFGLNMKPDKVKLTDLEEPLERFIKHFTMEAIEIEFKRIENLQNEENNISNS